MNLFRIRVLIEDCALVPGILEAATAVAVAEHDGPGDLAGGIQDVADVVCVPEDRDIYRYRVQATGGALSNSAGWDGVATFCEDRYTLYVDSSLVPVLAALGPAIADRVPTTICAG